MLTGWRCFGGVPARTPRRVLAWGGRGVRATAQENVLAGACTVVGMRIKGRRASVLSCLIDLMGGAGPLHECV